MLKTSMFSDQSSHVNPWWSNDSAERAIAIVIAVVNSVLCVCAPTKQQVFKYTIQQSWREEYDEQFG